LKSQNATSHPSNSSHLTEPNHPLSIHAPTSAAKKLKLNKNSLPLEVQLARVTSDGRAILRFNKNILMIRNLTAIDERVFGVRVRAGPDSKMEDLNIMSWNVVEMREREIGFLIRFEKPLRVSS